VIAALHRSPIEMSVGKRYPPMRARIAHGKRPALRRSPQNQRHLQQHRRNQLLPANSRTPRRRIPKIPQESSIRLAFQFLGRDAIPLQNCSHRFAHRPLVRTSLRSSCRKYWPETES